MSTTEKTWDDKGAWGTWRKVAPTINRMVGNKAGKGNAAEQRAALEKPPVSKDDGRRKRATGRTEVFNTKLKPEFRDKIFAMSKEKGIAVAALLEQVFEEWEQLKAQAKRK